jgi:hypothetical protein
VHAQTYTCLPASGEDARSLLEFAVRLTGADPSLDAARRQFSLPITAASKVTIVTKQSLCAEAAKAFHRHIRGGSVPPTSRSVVVVKVGATRYLVSDPAESPDVAEFVVVTDAAFVAIVAIQT